MQDVTVILRLYAIRNYILRISESKNSIITLIILLLITRRIGTAIWILMKLIYFKKEEVNLIESINK